MKLDLWLSPEEQILFELMEKNYTTMADVLIPGTFTYTEVKAVNEEGKREIQIKAKESSKYTGEIKDPGVTYQRYDWGKLFIMTPSMNAEIGETYEVILNRFCELHGVPKFRFHEAFEDAGEWADFSKEDKSKVLEGPVDQTGFISFELNFLPESLGYTGTLKIRISTRSFDLNKAFLNRNLNGLVYPKESTADKSSLEVLSYPVTFMVEQDDLVRFGTIGTVLGSMDTDNLTNTLVMSVIDHYKNAGDLRGEMTMDELIGEMRDVFDGAKITNQHFNSNTGEPTDGFDDLATITPKADASTKFTGQIIVRAIEVGRGAVGV